MFLTKTEKVLETSWIHIDHNAQLSKMKPGWNWQNCVRFCDISHKSELWQIFFTWLCWPICRASVSDRFVTLLGPRKKSLKKHRKSADAALTWQFWSYFLVTIIFMVLVLIMKAVMGLVMESVMGSVWETVSTLDQFDIYVTLLLSSIEVFCQKAGFGFRKFTFVEIGWFGGCRAGWWCSRRAGAGPGSSTWPPLTWEASGDV